MFVMAAAVWAGAYALELWSGTYDTTFFWKKFKYVAITFIPVLWIFFSLQHTGKETWTNHRVFVLLSIVPLATLCLIWTNQFHGLFYAETTVGTWGPFVGVNDVEGPAFWGYFVYAYLLLIGGVVIILRNMMVKTGIFAQQSAVILAGMVVPVAGNFFYVLGTSPFPFPYDITPSLFVVAGIAIWYDILQLRFLEVLPIARETVMHSMSDGILLLNDQQTIIDINPAACAMLIENFALDPSCDIIGQKPETLFGNHTELIRLATQLQENRTEIEIMGAQGQRYFEIRTSPIRGQNERIAGHFMMFSDITDRMKAEQDLRESEERYRSLFDRTLYGVYVHDFNGEFIDANQAAMDMLGYTKSEIERLNFTDLLGESQLPIAQTTIDNIVKTGKQDELTTYKLRCKNGTFIWVETEGALLYRNGIPYAIHGIARNITERKKAETELEQAYAETERALRLERQFKQDASHFFLNPIAICKGFLELAENEMSDHESDYIQRARNAIRRVENVILNIVERGEIKE
jgi:PAS domain S-box-containing protein